MFSIFKRKSSAQIEPSFKRRVATFWKWYASEAARLFREIENKNSNALVSEMCEKTDELWQGAAWEFSGHRAGKGHCFTLSGEGNIHLQFLTEFWLECAPKLPGWTFYAARQPGTGKSQLEINGHVFASPAFWVVPRVDPESKMIDLAVWHPNYKHFEENEQWRVLYLFLDDVLGEYGTQQWIGEIKFDPQIRLTDAISIVELKEYVDKAKASHGWEKLPPTEGGSVYTFEEPHGRFLRGDVITGTTRNIRLVNEYARANGDLPDPLKGTGADFVFVAFDAANLRRGSEASTRGEIEDALDAALKTEECGQLIGGAHGTSNAYIDLLLFDGAASIEIVRRTLRANALTQGATINYFAREKKGHRIVL